MSDMSARSCETPNSMEQACVLCRQAVADPDICGPIANYDGLYAHFFCLLFANEISLERSEEAEYMRAVSLYIRRAVELAAQKDCFVCGESGATIICQEIGCDRRFHLPCAMEGGCITLYMPPHSSHCWEHRPQQREVVAPEDTTCLMCLNPVEGRTTYGTMVCPVCQQAWFHRACIQRQALSAGIYCFRCPLCGNRNLFIMEMLFMGIRIPVREASWEANSAYAPLYQRHRSCDARECLFPRGREEAEPEGPWQLLLCQSCAAEGTHRRCSNLEDSTERWECNGCAGVGSSSRVISEPAGLNTNTPAASGQTLGLAAQETISPSTSRQLESGPSHGVPAPEDSSSSGLPEPQRRWNRTRRERQARTPYTRPTRQRERSQAGSSTYSQAVPELSWCPPARETHSRSTSGQQASASSNGSTALEGRRLSGATGPIRVRDRSRLQRLAQTPYARPTRRCESSLTPAAAAERSLGSEAGPRLSQRSPPCATSICSTTGQQPSASSHGSSALEGRRLSGATGPIRVRDRSRLQRLAQTPYTRPTRRCESSLTPAAPAERSLGSEAVPRLSQGSPAHVSRSPSIDSQESWLSSSSSQEQESSSPRSDRQESSLYSFSSQEQESRSPRSDRQESPLSSYSSQESESSSPRTDREGSSLSSSSFQESDSSSPRSDRQESSLSSYSSQESESSSPSSDSQESTLSSSSSQELESTSPRSERQESTLSSSSTQESESSSPRTHRREAL